MLPSILKSLDPQRVEHYGPHKPYFNFSRLALIAGGVHHSDASGDRGVRQSEGGSRGARQKRQSEFLDLMVAACQRTDVPVVLRWSLWMLCFFGCGFCTLFVFDAVGDKVGTC